MEAKRARTFRRGEVVSYQGNLCIVVRRSGRFFSVRYVGDHSGRTWLADRYGITVPTASVRALAKVRDNKAREAGK